MLPVFRSAEDNTRGANAWHGAGGPLAVSDLRYHNELSDAVIEAVKQKIKGMQSGLPAGVRIVPFYDRTRLIESAIHTVTGSIHSSGTASSGLASYAAAPCV